MRSDRRHLSRRDHASGIREHLKPSSRAIATPVTPASSAVWIASAVGADIATRSGTPIRAAFCTNSTDTRLVSNTPALFASTCAKDTAPTILSSALWRPMPASASSWHGWSRHSSTLLGSRERSRVHPGTLVRLFRRATIGSFTDVALPSGETREPNSRGCSMAPTAHLEEV